MSDILNKVVALHKKTNLPYTIAWYDDKTIVYPVPPEQVTAKFIIKEKRLECSARTKWKQEVMYDYLEPYEIIDCNNEQFLITYQGFFHKLFAEMLSAKALCNVVDLRLANAKTGLFPDPALDLMTGFRFSQRQLLSDGLSKGMSGLIGACTRYGKCLSLNELCLKYDYTSVRAADVKNGDLLMGPDGLPRKVTGCIRGIDPMYRIIPNKGNPFTCNADHILSLKVTGGANFGGYKKNDVINISVKDYLAKSATFKHVTKLYYAPLEFQEKELPFDPWIVGVWIGDGCFNGNGIITKPDLDVQQGIIDWAERNGYPWRYSTKSKENDSIRVSKRDNETGRSDCNPFRHISRLCIKDDEKYIPVEYLTASREQRLELLAGLIDTDGSSNHGMGYEIVTKYKLLSNCIVQLCRGLGFRVTCNTTVKTIKATGFSGTYYRIQIAGPLNLIPCRGHKKVDSVKGRVNPTTTGFTVEYIGEGEYAGFELEGPDHLFLMWDHLVTHNTTLMINTLRAFPTLSTVVVAPGVDLVKQLYDDITGPRGLPKGSREIRLICTGKGRTPTTSPGGITVCSADSLDKCDPVNTELLLADEPHALVTANRLEKINAFTRARRIGFGATLKGRFDGRDSLITGLFGPVLVERTYKEAVAEGAVCPLSIIFLKVEITPKAFRDRNAAYSGLLFHNPNMMNLAKRICMEVIPQDWQTMVFIKEEKQAEMLMEALDDNATIAMAKRMTNKERTEVDWLMKQNVIKRCLCTKIYVQGVTFSDVRVLLNLEGGGNNTSAIQKPGRLAEIRPGKKCGIVIDLLFTGPKGDVPGKNSWYPLCIDSNNRKKAYEEIGYDVHVADNITELKSIFDKLC